MEKLLVILCLLKIKVGKHIALALAPLSVLPKMQSQGIGGKLIERGHEIAKELGFHSLRVTGTRYVLSALWIYSCKQSWYSSSI